MISTQDRQRIAQAVQAAESRTAAQIVCVLARNSSDFRSGSALFAATLALVAPWPLIAFTHWPAQWIFLSQLLLFIIGFALFSQAPVARLLTPGKLKRQNAFRAATEQFYIRGLTHTANRMGVLIYVSLAERYARVIADEGLDGKVREEEWRPSSPRWSNPCVRTASPTALSRQSRPAAIFWARRLRRTAANTLPDAMVVLP